jgi:hypothetical protein
LPPPPDSTVGINVDLIQEPPLTPQLDERGVEEDRFFARSLRELQLEEYAREIDARSTFAERLYRLMIGWLGTMILLVLADAIAWPWAGRYIGF